MSAPLVVGAVCGRPGCGHGEDLHDGICFGTACECVRFVESAGALPMPAGPAPVPLSGPICTQAEARAAGLDIAPSVEELDAMASTIVAVGDPLSAGVSLAQAVPLLGAAVTGLRARVAELEAERHVTNEALDDAVQALRERQAEREALVERMRAGQRWQRGRSPELVSENLVSQSELRSIFGIPLITPWDEPAEVPVPPREDEDECACPPACRPHQVGCPQDGVPVASFAERAAAETDPGRRAAYRMLAEPEPEFHAYLRHPYRTGHDLPETGGTR